VAASIAATRAWTFGGGGARFLHARWCGTYRALPAATCPHCGAPTRVSLESPDAMACSACGYRGPPAPNVRQGLYEARQALFGIDARRRQLGWVQQRVGAGAKSSGGVGCIFAALLVPFGGCGGCLFALTAEGETSDIGTAIILLGPAFFIVLVGGIILRELRRTRKRVEDACAAVPPAVPGAPLGCHVCGADLPQVDLSRAGVVRCRFCSADNVVRSDILQRAAAVGAQAAGTLLEQVRQHALGLARHQQRSARLLGSLVLLAPFSACVTLVAATVVSPSGEPTERYTLIRDDVGVCVARKQVDATTGSIFIVSTSSAGSRKGDYLTFKDPPETFRATKLVGLRGRTETKSGKIVGAKRNLVLGVEHVTLDDDLKSDVPVDALCFEEAPDGFEVVDPPPAGAAPAASTSPAPSTSGAPK